MKQPGVRNQAYDRPPSRQVPAGYVTCRMFTTHRRDAVNERTNDVGNSILHELIGQA